MKSKRLQKKLIKKKIVAAESSLGQIESNRECDC